MQKESSIAEYSLTFAPLAPPDLIAPESCSSILVFDLDYLVFYKPKLIY